MVDYNSNGKVSGIFGIDFRKILEQIEQNLSEVDDNILDAIKKLNNKIDEVIPDKPKDSNQSDAI